MKFNTFLLGFVALCVAFAAAFFSVTGLSKLFAGASLAIILMAGSLETAKLVVASYLHNRWKDISKLMRFYLVTAVIVLIGITSAGIYGFLTAAYQTTADELAILDRQTEVIELKKDRFEEQLNDYRSQQNQLSESITNLNEGLANNTIQYTDTLGNVITTTSSATRRALEAQLEDQQEQRTFVRERIEALSDSVTALDIQVLDLQRGSEVSAEVGPLKYMAGITGLPMGDIVNYFALLIVFVFDPLAVAMVISFNHALMLDRNEKKKKNVEDGKEKGYKVYNEGNDDEELPVTESIETMPTWSGIDPNKYTIDMSSYDQPDTVNVPSVWTDEPLNEDIQFYTQSFMEDFEVSQSRKDEIEKEVHDKIEDDRREIEERVNIEEDIKNRVKEDLSDEESEKKKLTVENLDHLKRDVKRRAIDIGDDGRIDGYDTNGDGMIDEPAPYNSMRGYHLRKGHVKPYYAESGFNWNDTSKWINDQNAINYWLTYIKGKGDNNDPDDFTTKTY